MTEEATVTLAPQPGPQTAFLACPADIAIYGGAAGGGKTAAILLDPLRWLVNPATQGFTAVIFRRESPMITNPGGLWDESLRFYGMTNGRPVQGDTKWVFDAGSWLKFSHMQHESDRLNWQGSQIAFIGFDELTHFTKRQFTYMLSRNRSLCGVKPYIRATCNPDPDSWVKELIAWWLDADGNPIVERSGVVRWMAMNGDVLEWADDKETLTMLGLEPKSLTFIMATLEDNKILTDSDPSYRANLKALPPHEQAQLLGGNWNARAKAGDYFPRNKIEIVDEVPEGGSECRYWDRAATVPSATNPDPDWTAGCHCRKINGITYVLHMERARINPGGVEQLIKNTASRQPDTDVVLETDPGSAGKSEGDYLTRSLSGYSVWTVPATKAKHIRAKPASAQWNAGNVKLLRGRWNEAFLQELEGFPPEKPGTGHDDQVDAFSGAFNFLSDGRNPRIRST